MVYGFYFRLLKLTRNKWISAILAKILYLCYLVLFQIKRIQLKARKVDLSYQAALEVLNNLHSDPKGRPVIEDSGINSELDLSIVVPVYNYKKLIDTMIQSVLNQKTKYNYELILVDDGSTDGATEILKKYESHYRVKVIYQANQGIAGARNTGINNAHGKYLMMIDCDDTIHDDMVELLLDKAYESSYDIVMCAHNLSKEKDGQITSIIPNVYPNLNLLGYKNGDKMMNLPGLPWCKVYKRELWNGVRFFPGYWYEDTIIYMILFMRCKSYAYIPKVCYEYRWYENNFSHTQSNSKNPKSIDRYWLLLAILEAYEKLGIERDDKFYTALLKHLSGYYLNTMQGLEAEVVDALFVVACALLKDNKPPHKVKLPYILKVTEKAMLEGNVELWKLASKFQ